MEYDKTFFEAGDINEHLPILYLLSLQSSIIVELGTGKGTVSRVILSAKPSKLVTCDHGKSTEIKDTVEDLKSIANNNSVEFEYHSVDSRTLDFGEADLLIIDTYGSYEQLYSELTIHAADVKKYIAIHDTEVYGNTDERGEKPGLKKAIRDFLVTDPSWKIEYEYTHNNGLTILRRIQ